MLFSGSAIVTVANLIRDVALASAFGASHEADVLFLAMSIPLFLLSVAANAFRSIAVPALSKALVEGLTAGRAMAQRFLMIANAGALGTAILLGLCAALLYYVDLQPTTQANRQQFALVLGTIIPMYFFASLVEIWQGPAQAWNRFMAPSLLRLGLPCGIALGCLLEQPAGTLNVAVGGAIGALLAVLAGLALLHRLQIAPSLRTRPLPQDVAMTARTNFTALVAATCITYANPLVDQWIAGLTGPGGISMLGYASRLTTGILGLVAAALSQGLLVHYSRHVGTNDREGINSTYRSILRLGPWVGCFTTLTLWLTSDLGISLLYERGSFDAETTARVATLVDLYALQFPIYWTSVATFTLIWATSMNQVFLRIGILLFAVNAFCDLLFAKLFGINGIALTTSVVYALSGVLLHRALRNAGLISITARDISAMLAPFVLLGICWALIQTLHLGIALHQPQLNTTLSLALLMLFGGIAAATSYRTLTTGGQLSPPT